MFNTADNVLALENLAKDSMLTVQVMLRRLRNKELGTVRIRTTIRHRNHTSFMGQLADFVINGIAGAPGTIAFGVSPLNHESLNNTVKAKSLVKALVRQVYKVSDRIRSRLEIEVNDNLTFVSFNNGFDGLDSRIILVKVLSFGTTEIKNSKNKNDRKYNKTQWIMHIGFGQTRKHFHTPHNIAIFVKAILRIFYIYPEILKTQHDNCTTHMPQNDNIRNFSIIAHIDHGKSTLADRMIELTKTVAKNEMTNQLLDDMDLERERGITIKAHAIRMVYEKDGKEYILNMIDTPGHVDFTYEVSRSLAACEGAILVVDASQGIEAQTLSNLYLALENDLEIIPVLNKVDLPGAQPDHVAQLVGDLLGYDPEKIPRISAKTGLNVDQVLDKIVDEIPAPKGDTGNPLKALIFDSVYDSYRGVINYIRVVEGSIRAGMKIKMMKTGAEYMVTEVGTFSMRRDPRQELTEGMVGYVLANVKTISDVKIGDTLTDSANPAAEPLPGYKDILPMIYSGIYPINPEDYKDLREALEKLRLNDSAISWEPETSEALGFGFRTGFLGLLHMEIVQERLDREFNVDIITTVPNVEYHVFMSDGTMVKIESPSKLPDASRYDHIEEPYVKAQIFTPKEFVGALMTLCEEKRGEFETMEYLDEEKVILKYNLPLAEIMFDFYDRLKSVSRGYAGLDYAPSEYRRNNLVKLDILLNGDPVDAFSVIIHKDKAHTYANAICVKLKDLIPRQQFDVAIQGAIGGKIISRSTVKAVRKDVLAKCYGGDITRKRKLLEKQKEGKKRMKSIGSVEVPQKAFLAVLSLSDNSTSNGD